VNTILIATRHNQHARMVIDALKNDKNVYVEKPLAISTEELRAIVHVYNETNKVLMIGYNRRFSPSIQYLKTQLKKNIAYSIYYQVNAGYIPMDKWYQFPEQGGRIIGEVGHFVDTLQYLLDSDPVEVFANNTTVASMPDQDNTFITIKFKNGSSCVIAYLADGDKKYPKEKILITGDGSNIEFENFNNVVHYQNGKPIKKRFLMNNKGQQEEMNELIKAVKTGKNPLPFSSLVLSCYTTILAVESLRTKEGYSISFEDLL
jgi:polar amino acid transport system substrate-binding protein